MWCLLLPVSEWTRLLCSISILWNKSTVSIWRGAVGPAGVWRGNTVCVWAASRVSGLSSKGCHTANSPWMGVTVLGASFDPASRHHLLRLPQLPRRSAVCFWRRSQPLCCFSSQLIHCCLTSVSYSALMRFQYAVKLGSPSCSTFCWSERLSRGSASGRGLQCS